MSEQMITNGKGKFSGALGGTVLAVALLTASSASAAVSVDWAAQYPGKSVQVVGQWNMDETSGTTVFDSSGNNLNGSFTDTTAVTLGAPGSSGATGDTAYMFTRKEAPVTGLVTVPHNNLFDLNVSANQGFILEADVNLDTSKLVNGNYYAIFGRWNGSPVANLKIAWINAGHAFFDVFFKTTNGYPEASYYDGTVGSPNYTNGWIHVALAYDGATNESALYLVDKNGTTTKRVVDTSALSNPASSDGVYLGWDGNSNAPSLSGSLDNVKFETLNKIVPEPTSLGMGLLGLGGMLMFPRRRKV